MSEGLMWLIGDNFIDEIQRATRRFEKKYGRRANVCRMHGDAIQKATQHVEEKYGQCKGTPQTVYGIRIVRDDTVTPGHFLLCYEEVKK